MNAAITKLLQSIEITDPAAVAVDFETLYDKKNGLSVVSQGNYAYTRDPRFDAYLVSIYAPDIQFVGHPTDAPWEKLEGRTWLSHNRNFDRHVYEASPWEGRMLHPKGSVWHDTADLAVWSHLPRSLDKAVHFAFGIEISKEQRAEMDGKTMSDLTPEEQTSWIEYADNDAALCWALWQKLGPAWPDHEKQLSLHTGNIEFRGIPINWEKVNEGIRVLNTAKWNIEQQFPWVGQNDEKGKPYAKLSKKARELECYKAGVPVPETTSEKNAIFQDWLEEYGDRVPCYRWLSRYRKVTNVINRLETLRERRRPDDRASIGLKYFGADKTGRWSGMSGFSLHNMQKNSLFFDEGCQWLDSKDGAAFTVDVRACIVGNLCIADLAQIEPRTLNWVIRNKDFLKLCAEGMSPYEAHARVSMGWTGGKLKKENPGLYALAKARVLALGYSAGWFKFITMARGYIDEVTFEQIFTVETSAEDRYRFVSFLEFCKKKSEILIFEGLEERIKNIWVNAWLQVSGFREQNPGIKDLWNQLDNAFKGSYHDGVYENELPSGRSLIYYDISSSGGWKAKQNNRGTWPNRVYGGLLTENLVQAIARDVFALGILRLEAAGIPVLFHVHDEYVIDLPPDRTIDEVRQLIIQAPEWARSLPVDTEIELTTFYKK